MMKIIFVSSLLFVLVFSKAGYSKSAFFTSDYFSNILSAQLSEAPTQIDRNDCSEKYSKLYRNNTLRVSIFFGVMDTPNGDLLDRPAKNALTEHLKKECVSDYYACGFRQKSSNPTVLQKNSADSSIVITIHDSSVSESLEESTSSLRLEQEERSKRVTNHFLSSIESDAVVFYIGHSRFGTGPGFYCLPPFSSQWLSTYIHTPLLTDMLRKLEQTPTPPKILGLYSCSSKRYYANKIHSVVPEMALIVSDSITDYNSNLAEATNALNSIFGNICYTKSDGTTISSAQNPDFRLHGLFPDNGFPDFKSNASLFSITAYLFTLPILILIVSKFYSFNAVDHIHIREYFKDIIFVIILTAVCFCVSYSIFKFNKRFNEYSIPSFIILLGFILFLKFYIQQKNIINILIKSLKNSVAPLFLVIFILFVVDIISHPSMNQISISAVESVLFFVYFISIFPFVLFSTEILKYPLYNDLHVNIIFRSLAFILTSMLLYVLITYSYIYLNYNLFNYKTIIILLFFYIQCVSFIIYLYKKSTSLTIIFQTLALALILSKNIHGLFF